MSGIMGRRLLLWMCVLVMIVPTLSAQTGGAATEALRALGYTVRNQRTEGGRPTWDLVHQENVPFTLSMIGGLTEPRAQALAAIRDTVFSLEGLDIRRARIVFDEDRATAVISPRSYRIDGRDYSGFMPAGMQFIYDEALAYDFRMLADNLALRVNGQYLTEEQFTERIVRAINNPAAYIESSDPQFLARRLEEQQVLLDNVRSVNITQDQAISSLRDTDAAIQEEIRENMDRGEEQLRQAERQVRLDLGQDLARETETLRTEGEQALAELAARQEQALAELGARQDQALAALEARHEELRAAYEALLADHQQLLVEFEAAREGSIALAARKLFGALRDLNPSAVDRVVALRRADPGLEADDARDQVNAELPEGAAPLHGRQVQAIYALYFNDY